MNANYTQIAFNVIAGGIVVGAWAIALFFFRFWKRTGDSLFACFALSFLIIGVERIVIVAVSHNDEFQAYVYLLRLCAFLVIGFGILNKNRGGKGTGPG